MAVEAREEDISKIFSDSLLCGHTLAELEIRPLGIFYLGRFLHESIGHIHLSAKSLLQGVRCEDAFLLHAHINAHHIRSPRPDVVIPCYPKHLVSIPLPLWCAHGAVRLDQSYSD